jgi:hypothetical protein
MVWTLLRRPETAMVAYLATFACAGPWLRTGSAVGRLPIELVVAVVLAGLVLSGSRAARVAMIAYSLAGCFLMLFGSTRGWSPPWPRLENMACYVLQLALLLSTPIYDRTRPDRPTGQSTDPWLPVPRAWALILSAAGGLGITLLHLGNLRPAPCPAHAALLPHTGCLAAGTGMPFAYNWFGGYVQIPSDDLTHFLNVATPTGIEVPEFAADWAMWAVALLLALYLIGLSGSREYSAYGKQPIVSAPASP